MTELVPFKKEHYKEIIDASDQSFLRYYVTDEDLEAVEQNPLSVSCFTEDTLLGVGGVILSHSNRGEAWGIVAPGVRKHFFKLQSAVKKYLSTVNLQRIEAVVHLDYEPGHRWVKALGFELEASRMKSYSLDGKDASLYAITKGESNGR